MESDDSMSSSSVKTTGLNADINNIINLLERSPSNKSSMINGDSGDDRSLNGSGVKEDILKDVVAYAEVRSKEDNRSRLIGRQLEELGARVEKRFTKAVTHVIFYNGSQKTRERAEKSGVFLVSASWVYMCKQQRCRVSEEDFPAVRVTPRMAGLRQKKYKSMQPIPLEEEFARSNERVKRRIHRRKKWSMTGDKDISSDQSPIDVDKLRDDPHLAPETPYVRSSAVNNWLEQIDVDDAVSSVEESPLLSDLLHRRLFDSDESGDELAVLPLSERVKGHSRSRDSTSSANMCLPRVGSSPDSSPTKITTTRKRVSPRTSTSKTSALYSPTSNAHFTDCSNSKKSSAKSPLSETSVNKTSSSRLRISKTPPSKTPPSKTLASRISTSKSPISKTPSTKTATIATLSPGRPISSMKKCETVSFDDNDNDYIVKRAVPTQDSRIPTSPDPSQDVRRLTRRRASLGRMAVLNSAKKNLERRQPPPNAEENMPLQNVEKSDTRKSKRASLDSALSQLSDVTNTGGSARKMKHLLRLGEDRLNASALSPVSESSDDNSDRRSLNAALCLMPASSQQHRQNVVNADKNTALHSRIVSDVQKRGKSKINNAISKSSSSVQEERVVKNFKHNREDIPPDQLASKSSSVSNIHKSQDRKTNVERKNHAVKCNDKSGGVGMTSRKRLKQSSSESSDDQSASSKPADKRRKTISAGDVCDVTTRVQNRARVDSENDVSITSSQSWRTTKRTSGPSITLTNLHRDERSTITAILKRMSPCRVTERVDGNTTHVISGEPRRTLNILHAISRGCWILTPEWVFRSLESGIWIDESSYVLDEHFPSSKTSRVEKMRDSQYRPNLFSDCGPVLIYKKSSPPAQELQVLIEQCRGQVVSSPSSARLSVGKWNQSLTSVNEQWVLDSITALKCLPVDKYLIDKP